MEHFPKSLVFWKGESSALAILLKVEGEPLPRKMTINFSLRRPQHVLSGRKRKRNSLKQHKLFDNCKKMHKTDKLKNNKSSFFCHYHCHNLTNGLNLLCQWQRVVVWWILQTKQNIDIYERVLDAAPSRPQETKIQNKL